MAVVQSPWRPWTPTDSHAKEERAHMRGGAAKKRTKLKEHADGYHSGAREIRAKGTITGRRRRSSAQETGKGAKQGGGAVCHGPESSGSAPETQVGLSRSSVTIQLCDSYCLGLGLEELVARQLSRCAVTAGGVVVYATRWLGTINIDMKGMVTPRSGVSVDDGGDEVDDVGDEIGECR
ncbi:uncharacterized protein UDID_18202 [Ustilago sp. UG-2017a]|nr:uncharacterized protein UDID_18202 [Ustilago sp. UG-2017a]